MPFLREENSTRPYPSRCTVNGAGNLCSELQLSSTVSRSELFVLKKSFLESDAFKRSLANHLDLKVAHPIGAKICFIQSAFVADPPNLQHLKLAQPIGIGWFSILETFEAVSHQQHN
jgi:hypothetical protein